MNYCFSISTSIDTSINVFYVSMKISKSTTDAYTYYVKYS